MMVHKLEDDPRDGEPKPGQPQDDTQGQPPTDGQFTNGRVIEWISLDDIDDDVPKWAWEYGDDEGRIQNATLTLFAGRPGSGKSTAARYFVAGYTTGIIDGCYFGTPVNCAYIAAEESAKYVLKPSLRAANADMKKVVTPRVKIAGGQYVSILAEDDEAALTDYLVKHNVKVIVVDPIMDTFKSAVDLYRSNELRPALAPWVRIAEAIDGVVIAIVHFVKGTTGDIVASINGGSAFGEVARCIFGFAKDTEPDSDLRVMTQAKNSCGIEGLSLEYVIERQEVTVSTGKTAKVGRFLLGDESDVSVAEIITPRESGDR
jgi:AAA domain